MHNLYSGQEATVATDCGETEWFFLDKAIRKECIFLLSVQTVHRIYHTERGIRFG